MATAVTASDVRSSPQNNGTDTILELRPGIRYTSRSGRLTGSGSYNVGFLRHTSGDQASQVQHDLSARYSLEAVQNWLYIDTAASATRSALSAFGEQTAPGSRLRDENRTEVGALTLSPHVRGPLAGFATYELRSTATATNTRHSKAGDSTSVSNLLSIQSATRGAFVGWGLQVSREHSSFRLGGSADSERAQANLTLTPDIEFRVVLNGGTEKSNVGSLESRSAGTYGAEAQWTPNQRTSFLLRGEHRVFGRTERMSISHRLSQSTFSLNHSRDVNLGAGPNAAGRLPTQFDLLNAILSSQIPDPTEREQTVLRLLQEQGIDPNATVGTGFINTGATRAQSTNLSWAYSGRRLSFSVQGFATSSTALDPAAAASLGSEAARQRGYSSTVSYRLTPTASANVSGQRLMTKPTSTQAGTDLKSLSLGWTDQLGRRTTAAISVRYSVFNSLTDPYRETALTASLNMRF